MSLILGPTPPGPRVTRVYNRAELLPDAALVAWGRWLDRLKTEEQQARVLSMRRNRGGGS